MFSKKYLLNEGLFTIKGVKVRYYIGQIKTLTGAIKGLKANQSNCKNDKCKEKYQKEIDIANNGLIKAKKKYKEYKD